MSATPVPLANPLNANLTDAHLEPTVYTAYGTLAQVIDASLSAIKAESCHDLHASISSVVVGPKIAGLKIGERVVGYTRNALCQLAERSHTQTVVGSRDGNSEHATSPTKFTDVALWAPPAMRATMMTELIATGRSKMTREIRTWRTAVDAHNPDATKRFFRYTRAIVSRRHSAEAGDDSSYLAELNRFALNNPLAQDFLDGASFYRRDPAGESTLGVDSKKTLSRGARLTMGFKNNEIGEGSANVNLCLTFSVTSARQTENEFGEKYVDRITVEIPGTSANESARHFGARPSHMFAAFGEKLALVLMWAPNAIAKLSAGKLDADRFSALRAQICRGLTGADLRAMETTVGNFIERLSDDAIATPTSALMGVLVAAHFGQRVMVADLVTEFAGRV